MKFIFTAFEGVYYETDTEEMVGCTKEQLLKYLKGVYSNKQRFISRFINQKLSIIEEYDLKGHSEEYYNKTIAFLDSLKDGFSKAKPFTFKESFEIENREFQALVFSSIDIVNMIKELGTTRIKTDGINVKHRKFDNEGNFTGIEDYHNVYETHEINGEKLGIEDKLYAVKCWCTSTNKEHWIWIDEKYKDDPLNAIASTFMVHENVIPHIKALKRQGDLLLLEMEEDVKPEGEMVSLTKEQYFGLLVAQS